MKRIILFFIIHSLLLICSAQGIDRKKVVSRNNPKVTSIDSLSSLSVGNGGFAFTVDATGLQTFPERYTKGVALGTMSDWGWHSFINPDNFRSEDAYGVRHFGRGHDEVYSIQYKTGRARDAVEWLRCNPHRIHLGIVGFNLSDYNKIKDVEQELDLWNGKIDSRFKYNDDSYHVETLVNPNEDEIAAKVECSTNPELVFRFPYPTGAHSDDACSWEDVETNRTFMVSESKNNVVLKRQIDATIYYVTVTWEGKARFTKQSENRYVLRSLKKNLSFTVSFSEQPISHQYKFATIASESYKYWNRYWNKGGIIDFSHVDDPRARELERRVVLSQYLLAVNDGGDTPPQETGLTYNSWFGKFHLEMIWWHQACFALWGHPEILDRSLDWYHKVEHKAREIAKRQGLKGVRWMKMTDPSGAEAPSNVGSFLIWQQPHPIYLAELLYRATGDESLFDRYGNIVQETAEMMESFLVYNRQKERYELRGYIPAQETFNPDSTLNSPMELSYWHFALGIAQLWRERRGLDRDKKWDDIISHLSPLAYNEEGFCLSAENARDTYQNIRMTSDHPAILGALGILPDNKLINKKVMSSTLDWIIKNWNWDHTWGWDFPMVAMCAARLGRPETAVEALLMPMRTNTYLVNGHNYQTERLRVYLPGNGGLLTAVAMMCAGWDGETSLNPGFPKNWDVRWEGLLPLP